jgi:hypothetical protein
MMRNLEIERVALAAMSLGIARRSIDVMNSYAKASVCSSNSCCCCRRRRRRCCSRHGSSRSSGK